MNITFTDAEKILNGLIKLIYEVTASGDTVKLSGFGTFSVSHREARLGVNPRMPSQKMTIPKLNTPKFKAGEAFKEAVRLR